MKILHLINTLSAGGAELHLLALCQRLNLFGVEVVVAGLRERVTGSRSLRNDFERQGFRVIDFRANARFQANAVGRLLLVLREEKPDILHTHLPRADFAGVFRCLLLPHTRWVCSIHDIYSKSWSGRWALPLFSCVWRRADGLIAISHAVKDWLIQEHHIAPDKIRVIHYGIEAERFGRGVDPGRDATAVRGGKVIGTIGRLEPRKGHETLIRAMPEILHQLPEASLQIAGHDPWEYGQVLQAVIAELELEQSIQLLGFQNEVIAFLHTLDVFALASRSEGFGQVVIEAMAAGKPVVVGRIAPFTEIVLEGETGLLVEPENPKAFAEAICWLLTHPHEARCMGERGQGRVQSHFSAERMAAQTLSLYDQLLIKKT